MGARGRGGRETRGVGGLEGEAVGGEVCLWRFYGKIITVHRFDPRN